MAESLTRPPRSRIVIVGGGWAGMAAAVRLAEAGVPVVVIEAARVLGGRARRVVRDGVSLDNGLHILLGAYHESLSLIQLVTGDTAVLRLPLHLEIGDTFRLTCPRLPGSLPLLAGILTATGLSARDKLAITRFMGGLRFARFRARPGMTVAQLLREGRQPDTTRQYLWDPLCLAALNTDPALASAQVFLNVIRDGLFGGPGCSDLVLPATDLSALLPEPAARYIAARRGEIRLNETVRSIHPVDNGFEVRTNTGALHASHVVCAADPSRARSLMANLPGLNESARAIERLSYEPITSVYLRYQEPPPLRAPMLGATNGPVQWFFDRQVLCRQQGWIGGVISCAGPWRSRSAADLAALAHDQLRALCGDLSRPLRSHVITEKRATYACVPGMLRPMQKTPLRGFFLAGDYTHGDHPATLESATRSGTICARAILEDLR